MRESAGTGRSEPHSGPGTRLDTTDIEYARAVVGEAYCPHPITVRGAPARFHAVQSSLSDGPVVLDELRYGTECDVVPIRPLSQVHCIMQPEPPSSVARVIDHLQEHAGEPFSARALARAAGTSVRSRQEAVRRELQTSPSQALIRVRPAKARAELAAGEPGAITVADVATRWWFGNLGRFARRYAEEFGELPSDTLRRRH